MESWIFSTFLNRRFLNRANARIIYVSYANDIEYVDFFCSFSFLKKKKKLSLSKKFIYIYISSVL